MFIGYLMFIVLVCGVNAKITVFDENYDNLVAPKVGDEPVLVNISIFVLNVRSVKPKDLSFRADLFVHQYWYDWRLKFPPTAHNENTINLHSSWRNKIWIPDTYFKTGISGDITTHSFTTSYFVLHKNKMVFMASRISVEFNCDMHFRKYPHDEHPCKIELMSLSHKNTSVILRWKAFKLTARMFNTDFNFAQPADSREQCDKTYNIGTFSCVSGKFIMIRSSGNFFTKYIPSFTIVMASFSGFWIPITSYPARASIVVTSMLALITQQLQTDLKTSYYVCINIWMNLCTTIVFCCLLEFAFAIIWDQSRQKEIKNTVETEENSNPGRIKTALRRFEKHNRNPIDQVSKFLFPTLFLINCFVYFIYVQYT